MHDIHLLLKDNKIKDWGKFIRAVQIGMFANETIWQNETKARLGKGTQDHLLPFTHSVNGVRMRAGNQIAYQTGERKDLNTDKLNNKLCLEHGYDFSAITE